MSLPYGMWSSWVGEEIIAKPPTNFQDIGANQTTVFWTESRPEEKGRSALMSFDPVLGLQEKFPFMSLQTGLHEYGGGAFSVFGETVVFFDRMVGSLYLENKKKELVCLVQDPLKRFADFTLSLDESTVVAVCEDHTDPEEVENYLVAIDVETKNITILDNESPFYASPQFSPDGAKLAFLSWRFPHMPWEECFLSVADFSKTLQNKKCIGKKEESICEFTWVDSQEIVLASDRTGFWNLYSWKEGILDLLLEKKADFTSPLWTLGKKHFAPFFWKGKKALLCVFTENAIDHMAILSEGILHDLHVPYTSIRTLCVQSNHKAYFIGGSPFIPLSVVELDLDAKKVNIIAQSFLLKNIDDTWISTPEAIVARSSIDGEAVFGVYYPPKNPFSQVNELDRPPLIIRCHGGPTLHVPSMLSLEVQFWTSRGFGWLDVNYRGSSGFGRKYREALREKWGELDVQDCFDVASYLVKQGRINPNGVFARGSSSGGLTALNLATFDLLRGCVSVYGVTDLTVLAAETHKFERYYLESLIGDPQTHLSRYQKRSPLFSPEKIKCPVLFLHGKQDTIVPLSQAQALAQNLRESKLVLFQDEGHGFRMAETLQKCLEEELAFYLDKLGLKTQTDL